MARGGLRARSAGFARSPGKRRRHRASVELQFAGGGAQHAALGEEAHDLLGEERIALGLLRHLPRQRLGQSLDPEPRLYQAADVARRERLQIVIW